MSEDYRINTGDGIVDGKRISVNGEEYEVDLPRRGFLKASAVVAAGGIGVGSYTQQSQPVLAVESDDWSAADVESDAGDKQISKVIVGDRSSSLEVAWNNLASGAEYNVEFEIQARVEDDDAPNEAQDFELVASSVDNSNNDAILEGESGDKFYRFFYGGDSSTSRDSYLNSDIGNEFDGVDIINVHSGLEQEMFNPDSDTINDGEEETVVNTVELELTLWIENNGEMVAETIVTETFDVSSTIAKEGDGETSVSGSANTNIEEENV